MGNVVRIRAIHLEQRAKDPIGLIHMSPVPVPTISVLHPPHWRGTFVNPLPKYPIYSFSLDVKVALGGFEPSIAYGTLVQAWLNNT